MVIGSKIASGWCDSGGIRGGSPPGAPRRTAYLLLALCVFWATAEYQEYDKRHSSLFRSR